MSEMGTGDWELRAEMMVKAAESASRAQTKMLYSIIDRLRAESHEAKGEIARLRAERRQLALENDNQTVLLSAWLEWAQDNKHEPGVLAEETLRALGGET